MHAPKGRCELSSTKVSKDASNGRERTCSSIWVLGLVFFTVIDIGIFTLPNDALSFPSSSSFCLPRISRGTHRLERDVLWPHSYWNGVLVMIFIAVMKLLY